MSKHLTVYYYTAYIMRGGGKVLRQGTLHAANPTEAVDRIYEMGRKVWQRVVVEVNIMNPSDGELYISSTIGAKVQPALLPPPVDYAANDADGYADLYTKDEEDEELNEMKQPAGMAPWLGHSTFYPGDIGTYVAPLSFGRLISY